MKRLDIPSKTYLGDMHARHAMCWAVSYARLLLLVLLGELLGQTSRPLCACRTASTFWLALALVWSPARLFPWSVIRASQPRPAVPRFPASPPCGRAVFPPFALSGHGPDRHSPFFDKEGGPAYENGKIYLFRLSVCVCVRVRVRVRVRVEKRYGPGQEDERQHAVETKATGVRQTCMGGALVVQLEA